jgi:aminoglycoside phosphotransferase (APT) family kinase protein
VKDRHTFDRMQTPTQAGDGAFPALVVTRPEKPRRWWQRRRSDPQITVASPQADAQALLDALPGRVASEQGLPSGRLRIARLSVTEGRSATCVLSDEDRPRFVARIPLSGRSLRRCEENATVLARLRACPRVPAELTDRIPRSAGRIDVAGQSVFVETAVPGAPEPGGSRRRRVRARRAALEFLTSLHVAGRDEVLMDDALFEDRIGHYCDRLEAAFPAPTQRDALRRTRDRLGAGLVGRRWPLVPEHGDFHLGNCLFDADSRLTGVVDWDLGACPGMPVLDVLHALVTTERTGRLDGRTAAMLLREGLPADATAEVRAYGRSLGVENGPMSIWTLVYVVVKLLVPAITREGASRDQWITTVVEPTLEELRGSC